MKKISMIMLAVLALFGCEKTTEQYKSVEVTLTNECEGLNAAGDLPYDFCADGMVGYKTDADVHNNASSAHNKHSFPITVCSTFPD